MSKSCNPSLKRSTLRARTVSVLGSGKVRGEHPVYQQALALGQTLACEGITVFHGGGKGIMEAVAKGSRLGGGRNIGVRIAEKAAGSFSRGKKGRSSSRRPACLHDADIQMPDWQSRLFKLIEMGEAYVFLDGANGTFTEFFVVLEMTNRGLLKKPIVILGKKLRALIRTLQKDPHFDLPGTLYFAESLAQAVKLLKENTSVERRG